MAISIAPQLFSNGEFELPIIPQGDSFRVIGAVVARQLAFKDSFDLIKNLEADEKVLVKDAGQGQTEFSRSGVPIAPKGIWYLTEPGFYKAVGQRNVNVIKDTKVREAVYRFQRWVFHDVIPTMVRAGQAAEGIFIGTTWSWDDVATEIRQRYGLDYKPAEITRALRSAGWLKAGGTTPKWEYRWKFWHTGTAYHLLPHVLPELVAALVPTLQNLGDPQANQYQLNILPTLRALPPA